jgi:DNA-binding MarR family transcriptional regulator
MTQQVAVETERPYQQLRALRAIAREQIDTQNALAERLCIDAPATSRLVASLEKEKLLQRLPGEDKRCVRLEVTRRANREIDTMTETLEWMDREMRRHLTEREVKTLARILEKLNEALSATSSATP